MKIIYYKIYTNNRIYILKTMRNVKRFIRNGKALSIHRIINTKTTHYDIILYRNENRKIHN